jgi:hypothetical protein
MSFTEIGNELLGMNAVNDGLSLRSKRADSADTGSDFVVPSIRAVSALIISSILVDCTAGKQSAD